MSTLNKVLLALGAGDRREGVWMVVIAALSTLPFWLALAGCLAMGPGR